MKPYMNSYCDCLSCNIKSLMIILQEKRSNIFSMTIFAFHLILKNYCEVSTLVFFSFILLMYLTLSCINTF